MAVKFTLAVLCALLLTGCTWFAPPKTGSLCTVGPFRPDAGADQRWTVGEKDQLIILNESGERICGWRP